MKIATLKHLFVQALLVLLTILFITTVNAAPPDRVARLSYKVGAVSYSPAGEKEWYELSTNRPLTTGDRLWTDDNARAELQLNNATLHFAGSTSVSILNLDNKTAQFQLLQGTLSIQVWDVKPNQVTEIDTPNLAFVIQKPGKYRFDVDATGNATSVVIRDGQGAVYGKNVGYVMDKGKSCRFTGTELSNYQCDVAAAEDDFDRWCYSRIEKTKNAACRQYVSRSVLGCEDLDTYGRWRSTPKYGNVWTPNERVRGWAPYRDGRWEWIGPWGWTWEGDEPWGFAPYHYGRWAFFDDAWSWVPSPFDVEPVYAPAFVAFLGDPGIGFSFATGVAGLAWFPLGPGDPYIPWYGVNERYFTQINLSNTVINRGLLRNAFRDPSFRINYPNRLVPSAVTGVPRNAFLRGDPVRQAAITVSSQLAASSRIARAAGVAPLRDSLNGGARVSRIRPADQVLNRQSLARSVPPRGAVPFAAQQERLARSLGRPLDQRQLNRLNAVPFANVQRTSRAMAAGVIGGALTGRAVPVGTAPVGAMRPGPTTTRPQPGATGVRLQQIPPRPAGRVAAPGGGQVRPAVVSQPPSARPAQMRVAPRATVAPSARAVPRTTVAPSARAVHRTTVAPSVRAVPRATPAYHPAGRAVSRPARHAAYPHAYHPARHAAYPRAYHPARHAVSPHAYRPAGRAAYPRAYHPAGHAMQPRAFHPAGHPAFHAAPAMHPQFHAAPHAGPSAMPHAAPHAAPGPRPAQHRH